MLKKTVQRDYRMLLRVFSGDNEGRRISFDDIFHQLNLGLRLTLNDTPRRLYVMALVERACKNGHIGCSGAVIDDEESFFELTSEGRTFLYS